jgi:hypothetical protein
MNFQTTMEHTHTGPLATIMSLASALVAHIVANDLPLHAIASIVAIVAGVMSIAHYARLLFKKG